MNYLSEIICFSCRQAKASVIKQSFVIRPKLRVKFWPKLWIRPKRPNPTYSDEAPGQALAEASDPAEVAKSCFG